MQLDFQLLITGLLWPNGWMDQDATWYGGRPRPRPHCVRWGPSSPERGTAAPATFRPMSIVAKQLPISATAELLLWPMPCSFFLSIFFFYSTPNLSGHRLDVYHTSTHGVALVRIYNAGLKYAARGFLKVKIQDAKITQKIAICAPSHNIVGLYLCN